MANIQHGQISCAVLFVTSFIDSLALLLRHCWAKVKSLTVTKRL